MQSLLKGICDQREQIPFQKHIGELAEWSNAAVLKTVDLNGSGGSNPSLSANERKKWRQVYLNAIFFAHLHRPAAGGEGCRSVATKSRRVLCSAFVRSKGPTGKVQGMSERSDEITHLQADFHRAV